MGTSLLVYSSQRGRDNVRLKWSCGIDILVLSLVCFLITSVCLGQASGNCEHGKAEVSLDVNNVRATIYNNGSLFWRGGPGVYTVPKNGEINAISSSMIWIGGKIDGEIRFAGTAVGPWEFWPGPLDDMGNPPVDCTVYDRIYSIYRDSLLYYEQTGIATTDLIDWPVELGAPVIDGDGIPDNFDLEGGDRPALIGDQMLWWVMNDAGNTKHWSKRLPFPLEVQVTVIAFNDFPEYPFFRDALRHTTFYQFRLIYKGVTPLEDTWFGLDVDPTLGYGHDDYAGSDSTLGLAFVYNGDDYDEDFGSHLGYRDRLPAIGFDFLQGPIILSDARDNDNDHEIDEPGERAGMTRFLMWSHDGSVQGHVNGTTDRPYGYLRGIWRDGTPMTFGGNGYGGRTPTHFLYSGNPPNYWSEERAVSHGGRNPPGYRNFVMSTGPFRMEPGEEQEIILGIIWSRGRDRLDSVYKLKAEDAVIQEAIDMLLEPRLPVVETAEEIPNRYTLVHNYPNPFAGATTFTYDLPADDSVLLRVYDVLGRVIETLVDMPQPAGRYEVEFDGSSLPAGVYFYRFSTTRVDGAHEMVVMR